MPVRRPGGGPAMTSSCSGTSTPSASPGGRPDGRHIRWSVSVGGGAGVGVPLIPCISARGGEGGGGAAAAPTFNHWQLKDLACCPDGPHDVYYAAEGADGVPSPPPASPLPGVRPVDQRIPAVGIGLGGGPASSAGPLQDIPNGRGVHTFAGDGRWPSGRGRWNEKRFPRAARLRSAFPWQVVATSVG